ncbi:MAG TPA: hypothetical protein VNH53_06625 [Sphingomicrobium sp.]|jgi:hypothetical protein|nr:hypothetical protein [Sphingomicrobium sp.]
MRSYRLYRLDGSGQIESATVIDAADDEDAAAQARALLGRRRGELWHGRRMIGTFPSHSPTSTD